MIDATIHQDSSDHDGTKVSDQLVFSPPNNDHDQYDHNILTYDQQHHHEHYAPTSSILELAPQNINYTNQIIPHPNEYLQANRKHTHDYPHLHQLNQAVHGQPQPEQHQQLPSNENQINHHIGQKTLPIMATPAPTPAAAITTTTTSSSSPSSVTGTLSSSYVCNTNSAIPPEHQTDAAHVLPPLESSLDQLDFNCTPNQTNQQSPASQPSSLQLSPPPHHDQENLLMYPVEVGQISAATTLNMNASELPQQIDVDCHLATSEQFIDHHLPLSRIEIPTGIAPAPFTNGSGDASSHLEFVTATGVQANDDDDDAEVDANEDDDDVDDDRPGEDEEDDDDEDDEDDNDDDDDDENGDDEDGDEDEDDDDDEDGDDDASDDENGDLVDPGQHFHQLNHQHQPLHMIHPSVHLQHHTQQPLLMPQSPFGHQQCNDDRLIEPIESCARAIVGEPATNDILDGERMLEVTRKLVRNTERDPDRDLRKQVLLRTAMKKLPNFMEYNHYSDSLDRSFHSNISPQAYYEHHDSQQKFYHSVQPNAIQMSTTSLRMLDLNDDQDPDLATMEPEQTDPTNLGFDHRTNGLDQHDFAPQHRYDQYNQRAHDLNHYETNGAMISRHNSLDNLYQPINGSDINEDMKNERIPIAFQIACEIYDFTCAPDDNEKKLLDNLTNGYYNTRPSKESRKNSDDDGGDEDELADTGDHDGSDTSSSSHSSSSDDSANSLASQSTESDDTHGTSLLEASLNSSTDFYHSSHDSGVALFSPKSNKRSSSSIGLDDEMEIDHLTELSSRSPSIGSNNQYKKLRKREVLE